MNEQPKSGVHHEPIVSETLKQGAQQAQERAEQAEHASETEEQSLEVREHEGPRKQHGDALLDGSGTRHGVDDRKARPNL